MTRNALASLLVVVLAGCGSSETSPEPSAAQLTRYEGLDKAKTDAEIMLGKLGVEEKQRRVLLSEFNALLAEADVARSIKELGLTAVCAAVGGSGGLVVKVSSASGLVCFAGGRQAVPVDVSGWSAGAVAGGDKVAAVGIVCGLRSEKDFVGDYNITVRGSAGGEIGSRVGTGQSKTGPQVVHWVGTAVGLSGDLSAGTLTVSFTDAPK